MKQSVQLGRRRCHLVRIRNLAAGGSCRSSSRAGSRLILEKIALQGRSAGGTWSRPALFQVGHRENSPVPGDSQAPSAGALWVSDQHGRLTE